MQVTEYEGAVPDLGPRTPKPEGVGVTRIVRSILEEEQPGRYTSAAPEEARLALGYIWEELLSEALVRHAARGGAPVQTVFDADGIVGVVDRLTTTDWVVEEYKCTFASARRPIDDPFHAYWHMQGMAYCYLTQSDTCRYHVLYICGDYTRPFVPLWRQAEIRWTPDELLENWAMLLNHGRQKGWLKES